MRENRINLVEAVYKANPNATDETVRHVVDWVFEKMPSNKTVSVWKARLRKKGVDIPDRRKKKGD